MRSRHSIKTRVTAWYVFFLVLVVCLLFFILIYTSNRMIQNDVKGDLQTMVEYSLKDVEVSNGQLHIDNHMISYRDGISILVYKENNFIVTGSLPDNVQKEIPFIHGTVRTIEDNGNKFYVYDYLIDAPNYSDVWVRGITSANLKDSDPTIAWMSKAFLIILPLLILIAALGGYSITRRAFRPVAQIVGTVQGIEAGGDLSKRIDLDSSHHTKDEIHQLASTFDNMLDRLEDSFESEKQFSNDASHELRTPLAVIMAQCEYALQNEDTDKEALLSLEVIYGQSKKMTALINKLLLIARAERGTLKLHIEKINVSELTGMVLLEQELLAEEKEITIQSDIQPDLWAEVDESMFIRVLSNLISNSIKYGKVGGTTSIKLTAENGQLTGRVEDDGIGISAENLPKIWNRFYQVDPSRSREGSGAGLGLSMVKWIITEHRGTIDAESTLGKGSVFTFTLPFTQEHKEELYYESNNQTEK